MTRVHESFYFPLWTQSLVPSVRYSVLLFELVQKENLIKLQFTKNFTLSPKRIQHYSYFEVLIFICTVHCTITIPASFQRCSHFGNATCYLLVK